MIDIHTHILPGIDDGAKSIEESMKIIDLAVAQGTTQIVLTPHFKSQHKKYKYNTKDVILERFNEFVQTIHRDDVQFYCGCEIYYDKNTINLLKEKELLTINQSEYILLEFPINFFVEDMEEALYNISILGYKVIIAHIERYCNWLSFDDMLRIKKDGYLIQVNGSSILKEEGKKACQIAKKLIKAKAVDFIASDSHNADDRGPGWNKVNKLLKRYPLINSHKPFLITNN